MPGIWVKKEPALDNYVVFLRKGDTLVGAYYLAASKDFVKKIIVLMT